MEHGLASIALTSLVIGLAAGAVMHRSDYCLAGAVRDLFLFRNPFLPRTLLLLVVSSMILFEGARLLGRLPFYPFPLLGEASLASIAGGALFGVGMVLSGGCVVGTLYRLGAGSFPSFLAFLGLVAGSVLYAAIHPWWASFARATALFRGRVTLSQLLGVGPAWLVLPVGAASLYLFDRWRREGKWSCRARVRGYLQPWMAVLILSVLGLVSCLGAGMPMGVTTSYAKMGAYAASAVAPDRLEALSYFRAVPLDVRNPLSGVVLRGGPGPVLDAIAAIQFPLILGVVLGSALSAVSLGEFRLSLRVPARQAAAALCGGVLMGLASRMAPGCNVWHLLGGLPIFALQSLCFAAGLLPGAWLGGRMILKIL